jgi:hypothetical protein
MALYVRLSLVLLSLIPALRCISVTNDSQCVLQVSPLLLGLNHQLQQVFQDDLTITTNDKHSLELCLPLPKARKCLTVPVARHCYKLDATLPFPDLVETINDDCSLWRNLDGSLQWEQQRADYLYSQLYTPTTDASGTCEERQMHTLDTESFWNGFVLPSKPVVIRGETAQSTH